VRRFEAGDPSRHVILAAAECLLGQQVGLRDHADHQAVVIEHWKSADPELPQGGGDRRERRVVPYRDHPDGHHVLDQSVHRAPAFILPRGSARP
jgi:hypothetical protein